MLRPYHRLPKIPHARPRVGAGRKGDDGGADDDAIGDLGHGVRLCGRRNAEANGQRYGRCRADPRHKGRQINRPGLPGDRAPVTILYPRGGARPHGPRPGPATTAPRRLGPSMVMS